VGLGLYQDLREPPQWRRGWRAAILITPVHHPLEIAEQAAVVDQLSGGRQSSRHGVIAVRDAPDVAATSSRLRHDRRRCAAQGGAGRAELDGSPSGGPVGLVIGT
jgi:hypothetical protein